MIKFWKIGEPNHEFSNWYVSVFQYKGQKFISSEQAFMWEKAKLFGDETTAKQILNASVQAEIKAFGRLVQNFDQKTWDACKEQTMYDVNYAKFSSNDVLKKKLLDTDDEIIAECSPVDNIWGIGISAENADNQNNWKGLNLLGKVLMKVRETLRNEK